MHPSESGKRRLPGSLLDGSRTVLSCSRQLARFQLCLPADRIGPEFHRCLSVPSPRPVFFRTPNPLGGRWGGVGQVLQGQGQTKHVLTMDLSCHFSGVVSKSRTCRFTRPLLEKPRMLLLLHARTNLYWRFCQSLAGSAILLAHHVPAARPCGSLLSGALKAILSFGGSLRR